MPSRSDVDRIYLANREISRRVERDMRAAWASLDLSNPERVRDFLLRFVPLLTTTYGRAAATVAADWFDALRASERVPGRFRATLADPFPAEFVQERVRYGAGHLFTETPELMLPFLLGAAQEYALQPGRDTIVQLSFADPEASGWHREARGATTCKFCRMLVGRGGVYRKETASFAAHGNCDCVAVPSWDALAPEVPASAYVGSKRMDSVRYRAANDPDPVKRAKAQRVLDDHRRRTREYLAALDD